MSGAEPLNEFEVRFWPTFKPIPDGWVRHDGLDDTHHGTHATIIVKEQPNLCQCGKPLVEEQMHGHYVCMSCKTITAGCCGDV